MIHYKNLQRKKIKRKKERIHGIKEGKYSLKNICTI